MAIFDSRCGGSKARYTHGAPRTPFLARRLLVCDIAHCRIPDTQQTPNDAQPTPCDIAHCRTSDTHRRSDTERKRTLRASYAERIAANAVRRAPHSKGSMGAASGDWRTPCAESRTGNGDIGASGNICRAAEIERRAPIYGAATAVRRSSINPLRSALQSVPYNLVLFP